MITCLHVSQAAADLGHTYTSLGRILGKSKSSVSRWASGTGKIADARMVGLALAALYYAKGDADNGDALYIAALKADEGESSE